MKRKTWLMIGAGLASAFIAGKIVAKRHEEPESIDDDNEYLRGNKELDSHNRAVHVPSTYEKRIKPAIDSILSFGGLLLLSPVYAIIALAIKIDDPGPVFFTQKRVGKDKHFFCLHKFRTMKMSTPHDVPTHQLKNPDQYITRVGRFLRKTSLDELPQVWDIYRQKMSIIGPRPALWNQADLVAERDRYGANDVLPGLTGWAQINGRDELEIVDKAKLDGEYCERMSLGMDIRCFLGTIKSVADGDGVVEGGTGTIHERDREVYNEDDYQIRHDTSFPLRPGVPEEDRETDWGFKKTFSIDTNRPVRVLITGAGSYIGTSFEEYVKIA